jgi:predicted dehydrogenase
LTVLSLGRNLRIGIAGTGFGAAVHLPALQSLPGVTIVAIAGARQEKAAEIAGRYGIARSCQGIAALLAEDLDAVTLALPPDLAETAASLALDKGLAVLAEKPLASHAEAAEALARRATARTAVVDFEFAELDCFRALHGLIERGELGAIERVEIAWATLSYAHRHRLWSWKTDEARNGGVLVLIGTHVLFLTEWLFGRIAVTAADIDNNATQQFAPPGGIGAADSAILHARTTAGAPIAIRLCNSTTGSPCHRWEIAGERGRAVLENLTSDPVAGFRLSLAVAGGPLKEVLKEPAASGDSRLLPFRTLAERFVAAVRASAPCQPDFTAGARVQRLVADIEALRRGGEAELSARA